MQKGVHERILNKIVRKISHELSDMVHIIVPNGYVWQVKLNKEGRNVRFDDGWQDFVEAYSISVGSLVLFEYESNSTFQAHIYDETAWEINYPSSDKESHTSGEEFHP
ncbi:B3 domain-containing transcription factor VRN1-like [Citrus sinensis]|uniref:B3 domain-containing transcription factor VRN1-like n=1 Tax=Citrus sinensis TaxID=2711 RepID=UPI002278B4A0|nr:B3 domain-containing transcription factor VRN1-like [Citrus sinensis]